MLRRLARLKFRLMRVNPYIQLFGTLLLIDIAGWRWWFPFAALGFLAAYLFEKYYGVKGEMDVTWANSEEWKTFKKEFSALKRRIG